MGAWGYSTFDNDTACDFKAVMINEKEIIRACSKKNFDYDEVRASAETIIHLSKLDPLWVYQSTIDKLIECLKIALKDTIWLEGWNDGGKETKRSINRLIRNLNKIEGY